MGNVSFLGVEGAGKTVLTMALLKRFKEHEAEGWFLRPESNGAFRFLNRLPETLEVGTLPHQTVALRHLALNVVKDGVPQRTLDILDYPGEVFRLAFSEARDDADPVSFLERVAAHQEDIEALLGHLMESDQVFVLFNLDDGRDFATNVRNSDAVWITNACIDYLRRLPHRPKVTLLLTQIDRYVDLSTHDFNPGAYVAHHLPLIAHNFPDLDVLAIAALGPAEATYGIDAIVLRCLFDTPFMRESIEALRHAKTVLSEALPSVFRRRTSEQYNHAVTIVNNYNAALDKLETIWFCSGPIPECLGFAFPKEVLDDFVVLLKLAKRAVAIECETSANLRKAGLHRLATDLARKEMHTVKGGEWKRLSASALAAAIAEIAQWQRGWRWALCVMLFMVLWLVVLIFCFA